LLSGQDIAQVLPHERPVNMMFQNYALFPHLSVRDNIAFGLRRAKMPRVEIAKRVEEMVALVKLEGMEKRKPDQLSGGQRQRVALARSLARRPKVLLLDEPLAALDKKLREATQRELMELQCRLGMTFIIVTHDQEEAMTMASRIGVMDAGRIDQVASPRELYEAPSSRWIAEFVGDVNLFDGQVETRELRRLTIATRDAGHIVAAEPRQGVTKTIVSVAIRPEKVKLSRRGPASGADHVHSLNRLEGVVCDVSYLGGLTIYKVKLDSGAIIRSAMANTTRIDVDAYSLSQRVVAWFTPDDCVVLEQ
jgi:putrescine transport system ATP-binding protein